jgi:hypothetical protein
MFVDWHRLKGVDSRVTTQRIPELKVSKLDMRNSVRKLTHVVPYYRALSCLRSSPLTRCWLCSAQRRDKLPLVAGQQENEVNRH